MTKNDLRVLTAAGNACANSAGFIPHGPSNWTATRRLIKAGLLTYQGTAVCEDCDNPAHRREPYEANFYVPTVTGFATLDEERKGTP